MAPDEKKIVIEPGTNAVIGLVREALALWREYLDGKLERYNLHLKKRRMNAIKIANEMDETVKEIFATVQQYIKTNDEGWKEYYKLKNRYYKLDRKFDKLS